MKAHVTLDLSNPMALPLVGYLESLPFVTVEKEKKTFEQAAKECNAVPLETFIDALKARIEAWPDNA